MTGREYEWLLQSLTWRCATKGRPQLGHRHSCLLERKARMLTRTCRPARTRPHHAGQQGSSPGALRAPRPPACLWGRACMGAAAACAPLSMPPAPCTSGPCTCLPHACIKSPHMSPSSKASSPSTRQACLSIPDKELRQAQPCMAGCSSMQESEQRQGGKCVTMVHHE